jgi:hypothetical protein
MTRVPKPSTPKKSAFSVHTFTLTENAADLLRQLSSDASDFLGRTVSDSAIVRALIHQVSHQGPPASNALFLAVEEELNGTRPNAIA